MIGDVQALEHGLEVYAQTFSQSWRRMLAEKLGLSTLDREGTRFWSVTCSACYSRPRPI